MVHAPDEILRKNGLKFDGHIVRLKVMCAEGDIDLRKNELKEIVTIGKNNRTEERFKPKLKSRFKKSQKVVYLKWEHFDKQKHKFCQVKSGRGGGMHSERFGYDATYDDIMERCQNIFWKRRKPKSFFGPESHINFSLVDERHEIIERYTTDSNNDRILLTIYTKLHKCQFN